MLLCVSILQFCKECFCHSKGSLGSFFSTFLFLILFFLTPLSLCVVLYDGAGSAPCSLDPVCLLSSWLATPRSDGASRSTAQRKGLQSAAKPGMRGHGGAVEGGGLHEGV